MKTLCSKCGEMSTTVVDGTCGPCDAGMQMNFIVQFATATGKFAMLDKVEVLSMVEAKKIVTARHPTAKMVHDGDGQIRFTVKGRNVAFTDEY